MSQLQPINTSWCLEKLCESNYQKLFRLIPNLCSLSNNAIGYTLDKPPLHLYVLERDRYTLTIELSYSFNHLSAEQILPAVKIRVYLDARLAEVIRDYDRPAVNYVYKNPAAIREIQNYKWRLNYFLDKWLDHCLQTEYAFSSAECV